MGVAMYVVLEGQVELKINGRVVETLGPGEPFGEMALIDQAPRVATAVAKTGCRLLSIPENRFLFLVSAKPHFSLQIMRVMADRLRKMNARE
jgi:CRP-like cAMP-binding protein